MYKAKHKAATGLSPGLQPNLQYATFMLTGHAVQLGSPDQPCGTGRLAEPAVRIDVARLADTRPAGDRPSLRHAQSAGVRKLLRQVLPPDAQLLMETTATGQPRLAAIGAPHISLAHSKAWLACAVAPAHPVGVDIECLRARDWQALAPHTFHPAEAQWVLAATGAERNVRGLTAWCRREALGKALGLGLDAPWDWSAVAFDPAGRLIAAPSQLGDADAWTSFSTVVADQADQAVVAAVWRRADRAANDAVAA